MILLGRDSDATVQDKTLKQISSCKSRKHRWVSRPFNSLRRTTNWFFSARFWFYLIFSLACCYCGTNGQTNGLIVSQIIFQY